MADYITGRVKLQDVDGRKNIKLIKDKNKKLTFVRDEDFNIVVEEVPGVYGVRCGAIVEGFVKGDVAEVTEAKWPGKKKGKCTLEELMAYNRISKQNDTLVFQTECTFCTQTVKVDTKDFGLPQTRNRTYMFVWRPDDDDIHDDLGQYWVEIVKHLKSPVRHSLDAFMLEDDHDTVRVFREALNGPPGRQSKRSYFLQPDFFESKSANLPHNVNCRKELGIEREARFLTNWEAFGRKQVPPHFWLVSSLRV
jgi:site-specific DNA-cytosine methylase